MYLGNWYLNKAYKTGDIILLSISKEYYICALHHTSNENNFPSKKTIFWIKIDPNFLNNQRVEYNFKNDLLFFEIETMKNIIKDSLVNSQLDDDNHSDSETEDDDINQSQNKEDENKNNEIENAQENLNEEKEYEENEYEVEINLENDEEFVDTQEIPIVLVDDEKIKIKRKIRKKEKELTKFKKQKYGDERSLGLRERLLLLEIDLKTKLFLIEKFENAQKLSGSDYSKTINWLEIVCNIPHNKFKQMRVDITNDKIDIKNFFDDVKSNLDKNIYGLEDVKDEILEFVARKIRNKDGKGHVLALCGPAGVGKSKILKSLAESLELPFFQINCGGLNDANILIGHSETYTNSKPGKIVDLLQKSEYMNPIIYFDEIDKISEHKAREINGILTHLLDEEQNDKFQDNYLANVNIDLSRALFVISFNEIENVDAIVSDRMKIITIKPPKLQEKIVICKNKLLPEIIKTIGFGENIRIIIEDDILKSLILKNCNDEQGVRKCKKILEKILNRINYDILIEKDIPCKITNITDDNDYIITEYVITEEYIDTIPISLSDIIDNKYLHMYN